MSMIGAFLVGFGVIAAAYCERAGENDSRCGNAQSDGGCIKPGIPEDDWINMRWREEEQRTRNRDTRDKNRNGAGTIKVNYVEPEAPQKVNISYGGTSYKNRSGAGTIKVNYVEPEVPQKVNISYGGTSYDSTFSNYYPKVTKDDVIKNHKEGRIFDENLESSSPGEDMIYTDDPKSIVPQWIDDAVKIPLAETNTTLLPERSEVHWLSNVD